MTDETKDVVVCPLDQKLNGLVSDIMEEQDPNRTKDLVDLFNWNILILFGGAAAFALITSSIIFWKNKNCF